MNKSHFHNLSCSHICLFSLSLSYILLTFARCQIHRLLFNFNWRINIFHSFFLSFRNVKSKMQKSFFFLCSFEVFFSRKKEKKEREWRWKLDCMHSSLHFFSSFSFCVCAPLLPYIYIVFMAFCKWLRVNDVCVCVHWCCQPYSILLPKHFSTNAMTNKSYWWRKISGKKFWLLSKVQRIQDSVCVSVYCVWMCHFVFVFFSYIFWRYNVMYEISTANNSNNNST